MVILFFQDRLKMSNLRIRTWIFPIYSILCSLLIFEINFSLEKFLLVLLSILARIREKQFIVFQSLKNRTGKVVTT